MHDFLELFVAQQKDGQFGFVSPTARPFIIECCIEREGVIELLSEAGFDLSIASKEGRVSILNAHWKASPGYDDFIFGKRRAKIKTSLDMFYSYEIMVFISNGKVANVQAKVVENFL